MNRRYLFFAALLLLVQLAEPYKILGIFPHPGNSHQAVFEPLLQSLANNGHTLKVISHFPPKSQHPNYQWINMGVFDNLHKEVWDINLFDVNYFGLERFTYFTTAKMIFSMATSMCDVLTKLPEVQKIVAEKEQFDVILVENFNSDCGVGIAYLLGAPVIAMQSHIPMPWTFDRFRQPYNPSYIPCILLTYGPKMSFFERLENTVAHHVLKLLYTYQVQVPEKEIVETNLNCTLPPLEEAAKKTVGLISNAHFTLNGVKPLLPGYIEIGGMHLNKPVNPMDPELEKYLNESTNGVILFTLGSMIKVSTFKPEKVEAFVKTFAELKQNIIWKWEGDTPIENLSPNVLVKKWVPQYEILGHPNTVAFISHGGMLGTTEAIKMGKPVLFVPIFADQFANAAAAEQAGLGVKVHLHDISKDTISSGIQKVLSPEMRISAKELSEQWNDRPSPLLTATNFVEYVAKYKGRKLTSAAVDLNIIQFLQLDILLFLICVLFSLMLAIVFVCNRIYQYFVSKTRKSIKNKLQ